MFRRALTALPLALALVTVADASNVPVAVFGGAWKLQGDKVHVWANSPQASLAYDNRRGQGFAGLSATWQNLVPGTYLATPEGVVLASSRDGSAMTAQLTAPPAERQRWTLNPNINGSYRFAVIGRTHNDEAGQRTYGTLAKRMAAQKTQFSFHLGDAVESGDPRQLEHFRDQLKAFPFPTYALPGAGDLKGDGQKAWSRLFGGLPLSFKVDRDRFVMLDNTTGKLKASEREWLTRTLQQASEENARHTFIFLNRPLVDPRPGLNQGMADRQEVRSLLALFQRHRVSMVFAGQLPFYARETRQGVTYVITGGGGDKLAAPEGQGGFHHYVQVEVAGDKLNAYPVRTP